MKNILIYLQCFYYNRFTLLGFFSLIILLFLHYYGSLLPTTLDCSLLKILCSFSSSSCLGGTLFARETYICYIRTRKSLNLYGSRLIQHKSPYTTYCSITGYDLAIKHWKKYQCFFYFFK